MVTFDYNFNQTDAVSTINFGYPVPLTSPIGTSPVFSDYWMINVEQIEYNSTTPASGGFEFNIASSYDYISLPEEIITDLATNYFTPANFTMKKMANGDEIYAIDGPCNRTWLSTLPDLTFTLT